MAVLSYLRKGKAMFKQRYTAPVRGDPFYMTTGAGGYNKCVSISNGFVLANCTGYAWGRFCEETGITTCRLSTGNAQNWFGYSDGYERGSTPRIGAVMCWGAGAHSKYGHVAIVEEVFADGSVSASMSNYSEDGSLPFWERRTYSPPYLSPTGLPFQGFIYNPYLEKCDIDYGASDIEISGHSYSLYRQRATEKAVVLAAGINELLPIKQLDSEFYTYAKITGANYFQMRTDTEDPYGTTYGDVSAPLNGVWTEVPNQNTTLYLDLDSGAYGDCTGVHVRQDHNVCSPAVVYPATGNFQYATMVGVDHVNTVSRFTFAIRLKDGTFILGIANQDMTIKQIANDFRNACGFELESISFLDGGGSAQFGRWNDGQFEYVRDTGREVPSAIAIVSEDPAHQEPEPIPTPEEPATPETPEPGNESDQEPDPGETGENDMNENEKPEIVPVPDWKDPDAGKTTIYDRVVAMLAVKSIITLVCLYLFGNLVLKGAISSEQFMMIFSTVMAFYFGTTFQKGQK